MHNFDNRMHNKYATKQLWYYYYLKSINLKTGNPTIILINYTLYLVIILDFVRLKKHSLKAIMPRDLQRCKPVGGLLCWNVRLYVVIKLLGVIRSFEESSHTQQLRGTFSSWKCIFICIVKLHPSLVLTHLKADLIRRRPSPQNAFNEQRN